VAQGCFNLSVYSMLIDEQKINQIRNYRPNVRRHESLMTAAVAIILRDTQQSTEFLMMQRAHHKDDPWSGQMSFPGGKLDPQDHNHKSAAIREAYEEVGIRLNERDYIGQIDDVYGLKANGVFSVHVGCYVFKVNEPISLTANEEVADMVWVACEHLNDTGNALDFYHPHNEQLKMPAVSINPNKAQILWGLSLRMLLNLYNVIDASMLVLSDEEKQAMLEIERLKFNQTKAT